MQEQNLNELRDAFINAKRTQSGEQQGNKLRKKFVWRKATDKIFLRIYKGNRNEFLLKAIDSAFKQYKSENLFFASEL